VDKKIGNMGNIENSYRESVYAPWWVWSLTLGMCGSLSVAFGAALGMAVGLATFAVTGLLTSWALISSAYMIQITEEELKVGKAHLPLKFCDQAIALDPLQSRTRRGPMADPACYLVLRGWVNTAVTVNVTDPSDPTPYWFISSRHPNKLVAALAAAKRN